jgi:ketosteroid isomerase-like protein
MPGAITARWSKRWRANDLQAQALTVAFTGPADDRMAIRDLYDSYADGIVRMDRATWLECWCNDAAWHTHEYFSVTGREAIGGKFDELMADVALATFFTQVCAIEVDGVHATARALCMERLVLAGGGGYQLTGRFEDRLRRDAGAWRFERRDYDVVTKEATE